MKNDALNNNHLLNLKTETTKKVWIKPEVELISIQSGAAASGPEGLLTTYSFNTYHS